MSDTRTSQVQPGEIRILFLANAGIIHAQRWVRYFRQRGYQTRWLTLDDISDEIEAERLNSSLPHRAAKIMALAPRVRKIIEQYQPHIVNALFIPDYGWLGALAGGTPLAISAWGSDVLISPQKSWLHRQRIAWSLKRAALVFADAQIITDRIIELGVEPDTVVTVPLGVEEELLTFALRAANNEVPITVITNRQFEPVYRNETLVNAAIALQRLGNSRYHVVLIGDGSQREKLRSMAAENQLESEVQFVPRLPPDELYTRLRKADIYVSCSASDGTSVSLLEAMAIGLYPVVTDIPANREWIVDGENGRLFPVGDSAALSRVLAEVSKSPETWPAVQKRNREIIRQRALWQDTMAKVERALMRIVARSRSGTSKR